MKKKSTFKYTFTQLINLYALHKTVLQHVQYLPNYSSAIYI